MINNRPGAVRDVYSAALKHLVYQYIPELIPKNEPCPEDTGQLDERLSGGPQLKRQGSPSNLLQEPQDRLSSKTELSKYMDFITRQHPNCHGTRND